ncbi:MAG: hypothetical protein ACRELB_08160 [Polyangiaceae bacterium]
MLADGVGGAAVAEALCASGVFAPAGAATWYPCGERRHGCRRTVAALGGRLRATCGRSPEVCEALTFEPGELTEHVYVELALVALLQELFDVHGTVFRERRALWLGRSPSEAGAGVWLWLRPEEPHFTIWMREIEDRGGPTLVLVPTPNHTYAETFERYGVGQPISIVFLERVLSIAAGRVVRVRDPAPAARVPWPQRRRVERSVARLRAPAGTTWGQIAIQNVDGDTVAIRVGNEAPARLSALDLGMTRADGSGQRTEQWRLLRELCEGSGSCTRASVGASSMEVVTTRAGRLGSLLSDVVGVEGNPLHVSTRDETVSSAFRALPEPSSDGLG